MLATFLHALLAGTDPTSSPVVQGGLVGLLTLVLGGVGIQVRVMLAAAEARVTACQERSDKRLDAAEAAAKAERERDLLMQERMIAALLESADGFRQSTKLVERLEARLL